MPPPRLFINYRTDDTLPVATALARELERVLAVGTVFLDHRSIEPSASWPDTLRREVEAASVVLVLIGRQWLTVATADGIRRLDDPDDWVRKEIEAALTGEKVVIPLLIDGAAELTKSVFRTITQIEALAEKQALRLATKDWDAHFDRLVTHLETYGFQRQASPPASAAAPLFRSTVAARGKAPFVGRDGLLAELAGALPDTVRTELVVLIGPSGAGKSELAREYARRQRGRYPGGTFVVDFSMSGPPVDLAAIGRNILRLASPVPALDDQCMQALLALGNAPTLLVYDNAVRGADLERWLPMDGMPCHVIVTTTSEEWDQRWSRLLVPPLSDPAARQLVEALTTPELAARHGATLVQEAGGLPVQLVPAARSLQRSAAGGTAAGLSDEARTSFGRPWALLDDDARTLLAATTYFHPERIPRQRLASTLTGPLGWSPATFEGALRAVMDLSLLAGSEPLRVHRLLSAFVRERVEGSATPGIGAVETALRDALVASARAAAENPADAEATAALTSFAVDAAVWSEFRDTDTSHLVGAGLSAIGLFSDARGWYERAVAEAEQGDVHGRVDHESLGVSLQQVGYCLSQTGQYAEARGWYERAVAEAEQGDVHGRVDHQSLGRGLHQVGVCLSQTGQHAEARGWYERAVAEKEQGDVHGRVNHESLGVSLHEVGACLSETGQYAEARGWYERAVAEQERGDIHGRVYHDSLALSRSALANAIEHSEK